MKPYSESAETNDRIHRLSERVAHLEEENVGLDDALRRNRRMFDALLSNGHFGITLTGPDRRIVRVVKSLTDRDPASLVGQLVESLAVPEDRERIVDAYLRLLNGGCGTVDVVFRVSRADTAVTLFTATLTDMLDNPNVQGIVWNYAVLPSPDPDALQTAPT
jgi:PAS domain-containing protein